MTNAAAVDAVNTADQIKEMNTVRIALFGEKGVGKTTMLASFWENMSTTVQGRGYRVEGSWDLPLPLQKLNTDCEFPSATRTMGTYEFTLRLGDGGAAPEDTRNTIDLKTVFYDPPGGWFTELSEAGGETRKEALSKLLTATAAVYILDGAEYEKSGDEYLRAALERFRMLVRDEKGNAQGDPIKFPKNWVIALGKVDRPGLQDKNARWFGELVRSLSSNHGGPKLVEEIRKELGGGLCSFGDRYILLSSVSTNEEGRIINAQHVVGLPLLVPAALQGWVNDQILEYQASVSKEEFAVIVGRFGRFMGHLFFGLAPFWVGSVVSPVGAALAESVLIWMKYEVFNGPSTATVSTARDRVRQIRSMKKSLSGVYAEMLALLNRERDYIMLERKRSNLREAQWDLETLYEAYKQKDFKADPGGHTELLAKMIESSGVCRERAVDVSVWENKVTMDTSWPRREPAVAWYYDFKLSEAEVPPRGWWTRGK